ncbi:MAG: hypothetical protein CVU47_12470 [Chloroflexi bacterium HGW-Chloroflexi-9]|nr:MAG: hypothetical protein CVU47_12470 [Chloroflexi bacterium HGW-Chloroflexi-9]
MTTRAEYRACGEAVATTFLLGGWAPWSPFYPPAESFLVPAAASLLRRLQRAERDGDLIGEEWSASSGYVRQQAAVLEAKGFIRQRPLVLRGEQRARLVLTEAGRRT